MQDLDETSTIIAHLGGAARLKEMGGVLTAADRGHFGLRLARSNPRGVRSVVISIESDGLYAMTCYGPLPFGALHAEQLGAASGILPENLATVLGRLTGIESLHHHHY